MGSRSGSLGIRAVKNGGIPSYFTFLTLLRAMKFLSESQHLNIYIDDLSFWTDMKK